MIIKTTPNYTKALPDRLLLSRRDLHWNQTDLAEKSGVSRGHISNIERGHTTNVTVDVIFALADALKVSPLYLLDLADDPLAGLTDRDEDEDGRENTAKERFFLDRIADQKLARMAQRFITLFATLGERDRMILLRMAETMADADQPHIIGEESEDDNP